MFQMPRARALASAVAGALLCAGLPLPVSAAEPVAEFAVSPAQMQALGVTVRKLSQPAVIAGLASPARVVLPPNQDVMVSAPLDGVIDRLLVNPQDTVKVGQPLLRIASPAYGELQLKLMEADSRAKLARQTLEREKALLAEGIIPARRVQEAQAAQTGADAAVRQAEAALRLSGADAGSVRRATASGQPEDALTVRARTDGVVASLDAKLGQRVKEADPLLRIANLRELWLEVQVAAGTTVPRNGEITVPGREVTALVLSVGSLVGDSQTQTLRARVTKGGGKLRPGEVVQARVPFAAGGGWNLPLTAVTYHDDKALVFVRSAKGFVATPITVASSAGQAVEVVGNLKSGQEVAVTSVIALKSAWLGLGGGE